MNSEDRARLIIIGIFLLFWVASLVAMVTVAAHFIGKYW